MPTVEEIAEASKDGHVKYDIIEYRGVKLLIVKGKLNPLIATTYEFTRDPAVEKLAGEVGIKLRGREK